jgi:hypothetical protein
MTNDAYESIGFFWKYPQTAIIKKTDFENKFKDGKLTNV